MKKLLVLALALPLLASADDGAKKKRDFSKLVATPGTIVCLGCELEKEGADPQCTLHSRHAQGLKDADGRLWTILDNEHGDGLITDEKWRGKEVKLHAWKYEKAQYLEVWKFEVKDGDKWETYSFCKDCGWEKGDYGESELCDDCKDKEK